MKTVYISGPMRGQPDFGYSNFNAAESRLFLNGYYPVNPARNFNGDTTLPWETYMQTDIAQVLSADAIALLPGWQNSTGALVELAVALATGKDVMDAETLEPITDLALFPDHGAMYFNLADHPNSLPGGGADYINIHCPGGTAFRSQHVYTPQEAHDLGYEYGRIDAFIDADDDDAECCGMSEGIGHTCDDCPDLAESACCGDPGDCYGGPRDDHGYTLDDDDYVLEYTLSSADDHPILTPGEGSKKDSGRGGSRSVLEEAIDITSGARQASYGHPSEHYERTAAMWTAAFGSKRGWHFDAEDVPLLYMLDKISREINVAKRDNMVDVAGYARVRQLILEHLDNNPPF